MKCLMAYWIALFSAAAGFAQIEGNPDNWCREGFFTRDSKTFQIAVVKPGRDARSYFYNDDPQTCPDSEDCRARPYIVPGDKVLTNRTRGDFVCSWYSPAKGSPTVGWLKRSELDFPTTSVAAGLSPWLGVWKYGQNVIEFTNNKLAGFVNVTGNAVWKGLGDNVHVGELDGRYQPNNGLIQYSDGDGQYDCRASIRLAGAFLVVADNMNCGGMNVSFSGVYVRRRR